MRGRQPAVAPLAVTVREAARMLDCHPQQLYALVRAGRLPVFRMPSTRNPEGASRTLRLRTADLQRMVAANTETV